jgi:peptidyl-prolyl cis-trans isomerase C
MTPLPLRAPKLTTPSSPAPHQSARASHILLKGPSATADALALKKRIVAGEMSFADAARDYSACPSSVKGGDLGTFKPGRMVPQFDEVIFDPSVEVGQLATVRTQFGTHIIKIIERDLGARA